MERCSSGLKIEVLRPAPAGADKPAAADRVRVMYEGRVSTRTRESAPQPASVLAAVAVPPRLRTALAAKPTTCTARCSTVPAVQLADGTVFDSSYKRGQPIEFPLSGVCVRSQGIGYHPL